VLSLYGSNRQHYRVDPALETKRSQLNRRAESTQRHLSTPRIPWTAAPQQFKVNTTIHNVGDMTITKRQRTVSPSGMSMLQMKFVDMPVVDSCPARTDVLYTGISYTPSGAIKLGPNGLAVFWNGMKCTIGSRVNNSPGSQSTRPWLAASQRAPANKQNESSVTTENLLLLHTHTQTNHR